ncbi:MAG: methyltransferase domain-containing protein [Motiliproteus sp.]
MSTNNHFDQLSEYFAEKIYNSAKGQIRLALLQRDLDTLRQSPPLHILDAGGGQGHISRWFAAQGHQLDLCDASQQMLEKAQLLNQQAGLDQQIQLHHANIEQFCVENKQLYDAVICHAVLEWVEHPQQILQQLITRLRPGGTLSLMFYNQHSLVLRNALKGNFRKVKKADWRGDGKGLTPYQPLDPEQIYRWLKDQSTDINSLSGIRCFYDYLPMKVKQNYEFDDILELELNHYRQQPYIHMARYIHVMSTKACD